MPRGLCKGFLRRGQDQGLAIFDRPFHWDENNERTPQLNRREKAGDLWHEVGRGWPHSMPYEGTSCPSKYIGSVHINIIIV